MSVNNTLRLALAAALIAAAGSAAAQAPAAEVSKETVANPYGLEAMWAQGDAVAKITLVITIIMSVGSWYIIFTKLWEQQKLYKSADAAAESFWTAGSIKAGAATLEDGSAFKFIAEQALKADEHHEGTLTEQIDRHT